MNDKKEKMIVLISIILIICISCVCLFFSKVCTVLCFLLGVILLLMYLTTLKQRQKKLNELNDYLSMVCKGCYDLAIEDNTEGELSILKSNLYKVIAILKNQNEFLKNDKLFLADSIADISHQLKTPLTSIMVMCDLLENDSDLQKCQEFIPVINTQLSKMNWLITNILKISRLDADATEFKNDKVSISKVVQDSLKPFLVTAELKNIAIVNSVKEFTFKGDEIWSVEAVGNIIKNCIEHTGNDGKLELQCTSTNLYDALIIKDNGCGISNEDLPHIFERFYHGKNSSKESVGIGLALSKTVFEKENASVCVESEIGKGSTFIIKFYKSIV